MWHQRSWVRPPSFTPTKKLSKKLSYGNFFYFTFVIFEKYLIKITAMNYVYSVTNRSYSAIRGILTFAFGLCLLFWPDFTAGLIVKIIAAFLIAAGVITLVFALNANGKRDGGLPIFSILNICVYLIFGLLIFLFPGFFLGLIAFLFGAVLLVAGIGQITNLYYSSKYTSLSGGLYIIPIIIIICGIALFFSPKFSTEVLTMIFGGAIALYGISSIVSAWKLRNVKFTKEGAFATPVEDVNYEEVNK